MSLKIGITGGIGVGKSMVAGIFSACGIPVYDADSRAKLLMQEDEQLRSDLQSAFGQEVFSPEGKLDRIFLAEKVFYRPEELKKLNALVHPAVGRDFAIWAAAYESRPYVLKEAALLFESGSAAACDKIIVVTAPLTVRIERLKKRDLHRSEADIQAIINKQWPEEEKISRADFLVNNDGTQMIVPQVLDIHRELTGFGSGF